MRRWTMFWQLLLAFGLLIVLALGAVGGLVATWVEQQALRQVEDHLKSKAILLQEILRGREIEHLQDKIETLRAKTDTRITLIASDGRVLAESEKENPADLDNHGQRPEVEEARHADYGAATRFSTTINQNMMYVAIRTPALGSIAFLRVGLPVTAIQANAARLRQFVWGAATAIGSLALLLAWLLARRLTHPLQELTTGAEKIAAGDYGHKVYLDRKDELGQLADTFNHMSKQLATQFAQLDEDRQQLRAVLGSMVEGVIAIDAEQTILFANGRACLMLEFTTKTPAGRKLWELVRQHAIQDLVQATMKAAEGQESRLEFTGTSGKSLTVHVAQLPGEPTRGAVLVFHDTTELRRLERLRQDFVANVSHELKTPLSVITACVETLISGGMDDAENRGRFLERIHDETHRLHALILDLLSLARIESGEQAWSFESLPIAELAHACVERHQARSSGKKQTLVLEPPGNGKETRVWADEEALAEILDNLIDNAVKYTPEGGTIWLRWRAEADQCVIEVQDTGIGIPPADLPRIFERFYRVDKARSRELGGTGLGLSIVKHLVQAMHGHVRADSEPGRGSIFVVRLPRASDDVSESG